MADLTCELTWLKRLHEDFGVKIHIPARVFCENQAAIHISQNPVFHERIKHIELDCHLVRDKIEDGSTAIAFVQSRGQIADLVTKALSKHDH